MSINRVCITGNLTRDAALRATRDGSQVLRMGVAVNDRRKNPQTQQWEDVPNFVDCVMFGSRAEKLAQYLTKGAKVAVEGRLRYSSWEKDGQKRSKLEVVIDEIELMGARQDAQSQAPLRQEHRPPTPELRNARTMVRTVMPGAVSLPPEPQGDYDEDVPF